VAVVVVAGGAPRPGLLLRRLPAEVGGAQGSLPLPAAFGVPRLTRLAGLQLLGDT
jgi:hypothetical protein